MYVSSALSLPAVVQAARQAPPKETEQTNRVDHGSEASFALALLQG